MKRALRATMICIARMMAIVGGLVLAALVALVCISVAGRAAATFTNPTFMENLIPGLSAAIAGAVIGPIQGDFELVEAGIAFSIFAFLPLCQLYSGHATVDVFTAKFPERVNLAIMAFWEALLAALILLVTWRLAVGLFDKFSNLETTLILQFPVWWAYAASFVPACAASAVAVFCAWSRLVEAVSGRRLMPEDGEAGP